MESGSRSRGVGSRVGGGSAEADGREELRGHHLGRGKRSRGRREEEEEEGVLRNREAAVKRAPA